MVRPVIFLLLTTVTAGPLGAESLAEVAARERAKREQEPTPRAVRVYDDEDLKKAKTPAPEGAEAAAEPTPEPAAPERAPAGRSLVDEHDARRKAWRERSRNVAEQLTQARAAVATIQARLDVLKSAVHPTMPFGRGNPEVPALEQELAEAKERLAAAQEAKLELDREAVRDRVPSRWLQDE